MLCAYDKAVFGQMMMVRDDGLRDVQAHALRKLMKGEIAPTQMKQVVDGFHASSPVSALINAVRAGEPVAIGIEQVQCYNSLQAFQAHRFVVDPDGEFEVARKVIADRRAADLKEDTA